MKNIRNKVVKLISCLLIVFIMTLITVPATALITGAAHSVTLSPLEELVIIDSMKNVARNEGVNINAYTYTAKKLYLASGRQIGHVIDFDFGKRNGYVTVIENNGYEIAEISINGNSPFFRKQGKYIYSGLGSYIVKNNGLYKDITTNETAKSLNVESPDRFQGAKSESGDGEPVDAYGPLFTGVTGYSNYEITYANPGMFFTYEFSHEITSHEDNCANVAGLTLINHWNKYYGNDILKLNVESDGDIRYDNEDAAEIMTTFYDYMRTNDWPLGLGDGTFAANFYSDFTRYVNEHGYKVDRVKIKGASYGEIMYYINIGIPIAVSSTNYYFTNYVLSNPLGYDADGFPIYQIHYKHYLGLNSAHTFIVYGYRCYDLYKIEWQLSIGLNGQPVWKLVSVPIQLKLLKIADGWGGIMQYFNYDLSTLLEMSAVDVYPL